MTWTWIYAFTGLTGTCWVLLSGFMAGLGGGDSSADTGIDGGLDGQVDGLDVAHTGIDGVDAGQAMGEVQAGFPFLSPYVISSFLAGFGVAGYASLGAGLGALLHLPIALATGVFAGGLVGTFFHKLRTVWSQSSGTKRRHLLGATAEVSISIPDHKVGEVSLVAAGTRRSMAARSITGSPLPVGTRVRIERLDGSTAIVREPAGERLDRLGSTTDDHQTSEP